jgi:hypothetical protein
VDLTALVQGWVSDPETNFGTILRSEGDGAVTVDANSSEYARYDQRPSLIVEYMLPSELPAAGHEGLQLPGVSSLSQPLRFKLSTPGPPDPAAPASLPETRSDR